MPHAIVDNTSSTIITENLKDLVEKWAIVCSFTAMIRKGHNLYAKLIINYILNISKDEK